MAPMVNVSATFGALLLGGLFASVLSGLVALQVVIYFKMYGGDPPRIKVLVVSIWVLDVLHTALVWAGLWNYLIGNFGRVEHIDVIPWAVSATVAVTGVLTCVVHFFFSRRIFMLSRRNYYLAVPIMCLAVCRLVSASATTAEMVTINTFHNFRLKFYWLFTLGLALSSVVDILVTGSLFFLLQTSRTSDFDLNAVIDTLILYAFETGSLTTAGTIVSMICWLAMSDNLIFMGLHFVIAKLYANSILVTLNTRRELRRARSSTAAQGTPVGIQFPASRRLSFKDSGNIVFAPIRSPKVTINIERSVHRELDESEN